MKNTALIIGASRGLGLEFVRQYRAENWSVFATYRKEEDRLRLREIGADTLKLDTRSQSDLTDMSWQLDGEPIDSIIINAGVYGPRESSLLKPPDEADFDLVMKTNVLGPMLLLPTLAKLLRTHKGTLAVLSSQMGSITNANQSYGMLYRVSKAAENMLTKLAHADLHPLGVRVIALHPGWARTDMGGPNAEVEPPDSVKGMRAVIKDTQTYPSGGFYDYKGRNLPW